jgi:membrane-bound serine protease (ClpP class)
VDEDVDVPDLAPKGKLLTLTTDEAIENGIAELKVSMTGRRAKLDSVLAHYGLADARIYEESIRWSEQLVRWLTHPVLASLLMTLGFLGLIFEIQSPGWGVGGTVGLICLGLFFGSHLLVNLADWTEILIFLVGAALVIVDLFFITGFGVVGIPGLVLMVAGLWLSLVGRTELWTWDSVGAATRPLLLAFVMTVVLGYMMVKWLPRSTTWNRIILQAETSRTAGYSADTSYSDLMGAEGVAFTALRPAGTGVFGDRRISVATEGDYLDKNTPIRVVAVEGNRVVVRRTDTA